MAERAMTGTRMSRPNDARAIRSRAALREGFLRLIAERPLEQIGIRDITVEAGVSYPVFFRRYASKEELLQDIAADEVRRLLSFTLPMFDAEAERESLRALCDYVNAHRGLWARLLTGGAAPAMRAEFALIARDLGQSRTQRNPEMPVELGAAFVAAALFEILAWWLGQPEDYPVENVVRLLNALIVRPTMSPIDPPTD